METYFPQLLDNQIQIALIERMAKKLGVKGETLSAHWIEEYSDDFRHLWESWITDIEEIEERLYFTAHVTTNYGNMIIGILTKTIDPQLYES